ncbi:MAG: DNA-formamidopyrimidine glycosylase family protein [Actinomycetes bacterium]
MPELLEIEFYRQLARRTLGRCIERVDAPDSWYLKGGLTASHVEAALQGRSFGLDRRIGKLLLLDVVGGPTLGLRFGMTGRLIVDGAAAIDQLAYSSDRDLSAWDRFSVAFSDGGSMVMRDPRRLGGVELDPDENRLGPDALSLSESDFSAIVATGSTPIKGRLLDQAKIAGIGNLLADETLWRAGIDPARPTSSLSSAERDRLYAELCATLPELFSRGGSHTGDLQAMRNRNGRCPIDDSPLQRRTVAGRTTYSCPSHQL